MNEDFIEPLPSDVEHLLAVERPLPPATPELQAHVWSRLEGMLGPGGGGGGGTAPVAGSAGALVGALVLLVAIGGGVLLWASRRDDASSREAAASGGAHGQVERPESLVRAPWSPAIPIAPARSSLDHSGVAQPALPSWFGQRDVRLRPLAGQVLVDGRPAAGVEVRLESLASGADAIRTEAVRTDGQGRYRFTPTAAWLYDVSAALPGFAGAARLVDLRDPSVDTERVDLELGPCVRSLSGTVLDAMPVS